MPVSDRATILNKRRVRLVTGLPCAGGRQVQSPSASTRRTSKVAYQRLPKAASTRKPV